MHTRAGRDCEETFLSFPPGQPGIVGQVAKGWGGQGVADAFSPPESVPSSP